MDEHLPYRKNMRLQQYDYSRPGCYFVTICTKIRGENILCRIEAPVGAAALGGPSSIDLRSFAPVLTPLGEIVKGFIENIDPTYSRAHVDTYVIMPDHIHMILQLDGPPRAAAPTDAQQDSARTPGIPQIVNTLKGLSTKKSGERIWQRGYYDHIIRNDADLEITRQYIQANPLKWLEAKGEERP